MYKGGPAGVHLAMEVVALAKELSDVDLVVAPPFTALAAVAHECEGTGVAVAAQNMHEQPEGAFTGEVSAPMLVDTGCSWVIIGHSERRQHFHETDDLVAAKTAAAFAAGLLPIVCVGETLEERERGATLEVVRRQVGAVVDILARHSASPGAIAYEPVWAIGTGKTAGPREAEEVHAAIRAQLTDASAALAAATRILYGGSVKPENAEALLREPNVDGALVGGASLDGRSFGAIARAPLSARTVRASQ
jgi:triosephosphate isomerase